MFKRLGLAALATGVLLVGIQSAAAGNGNVTCMDAFAGTATNVIVPHDNGCDLSGATITHDVIVEHDAGLFAEGLTVGHDIRLAQGDYLELGGTTVVGRDVNVGTGGEIHLERTTIGGSLDALAPTTVQTGHNGPDTPGGPVGIARDLTIKGTPDEDFVFDGLCSLNVGHDARIVDRTVNGGISFGDNCAGREPNTVGHDLVFTNDSAEIGFFGPSVIEVGGNTVGHDLVFTHNSADPGGYLEVSDNQVAGNAICEANSPAVGSPEPGDGPNVVAGRNTCG